MELINLFWAAAGCVVAWLTLRVSLILLPTKNAKDKQRKAKAEHLFRRISIILVVCFTVIILVASAFGIKRWMAHREEEKLKSFLEESQSFELTIYANPRDFNRTKLNNYWVPIEQGGQAAEDIENAVQRLLARGWYYGKESKFESFEFESVVISGDKAEVKTRERWYLPIYHDKDGSPVTERKAEQSWEATYFLQKVNGKWLIKDTTLPYKK